MPGFNDGFLDLPARPGKPRTEGLTHVMDKGLNIREIEGMFDVGGAFVDIVKLGWGTSYVTNNLEKKIALYRSFETPVVCGGTLFEAVYGRGRLDEFKHWLREQRFSHVEISDGTIEIPRERKLELITEFAQDFTVLSEVGSKDADVVYAPYQWVEWIKEELAAGAWKVITEGREGGTAGIYRPTGEMRTGLVDEIVHEIAVSELVHMVSELGLDVPVIELDTQLFFRESYETRDRLVERYGLTLQSPQVITVAEQHKREGPNLWETDPDRCCHIRKVEPLLEALGPYDAWISGIRRDQSPSRATTPKLQWSERYRVWKFHPLADWDEKRVWAYIQVNEIPFNPLHESGYRSIGCIPCTRPTAPDEEERAGRWAGSDKLECGIHTDTLISGTGSAAMSGDQVPGHGSGPGPAGRKETNG